MAREGCLNRGPKGASPVSYSVLTTVADALAKELALHCKSSSKIVEAPGVEGRRGTCGLVKSRDVSCGKEADSGQMPQEAETSNAVSCGLVEDRCSTEVDEASECSEDVEAEDEPGGVDSATCAQGSVITTTDALLARLSALEHLVAAIARLLEVGDADRAGALARAWSITAHGVRNDAE